MKKQFRHEAHGRQDKANKSDYAESMKAGTPSTGPWSGVDVKKLNARKALRDDAKQQASQFFFAYGKWLFQHTRKLSSFARLNSNHTTADSPETEAAFQSCKKKWESDIEKIHKAIGDGVFVEQVGIAKYLWGAEVLNYEFPSDLLADDVSEKPPSAFRHPTSSRKASS